MSSCAGKSVCLIKAGAVCIALLLMFSCVLSCTENNGSFASTQNKPTEYQTANKNNAARVLGVKGTWVPALNVANIQVPNDIGGAVRGPILSNVAQGYFLNGYQLSSGQNRQTGAFDKVETQFLRIKTDTGSWGPVSIPDFIPVSTPSSEKIFISSQRNKSGNEILSLWHYGDAIYLAVFNSISGWQKNIFVANAPTADFKILSDETVVVWMPVIVSGSAGTSNTNTAQRKGLLLTRYSASLDVLSSIVNPDLPYDDVKFAEAKTGLHAVWTVSIGTGTQIESAKYDWSSGWKAIEHVKSLTSYVSQIELFNNAITGDVKLAYVVAGPEYSIYEMTNNNAWWDVEKRLDDQIPDFKMSSAEVSFFANQNSAALAWIASSIEPSGAIQRVVSIEFSGGKGWLPPEIVSGDVLVGDGLMLRQLKMVFGQKKMLSWIEARPSGERFIISQSNGSEWGLPELIHAVNKTVANGNNITITDTSMSIDEVDNVIVSWQQVETQILHKNISIWFSVPFGQGGGVQTPAIALPASDSPLTESFDLISRVSPESISGTGTAITTPIAMAAHWAEPQQVWSQTYLGNLEHHIYGPDLYINNGGEAYLSIHRALGYNPAINTYKNMQSQVLHRAVNANWAEELPYPAGTLDTTYVEIKQVNNTGNAYALWTLNGLLNFNYYVAGQGWQSEQAIGFETYHYHLMVDSADNGYLFWVTNGVMHFAKYIPGAGLQPTETFTASEVLFYALPVVQDDNSIIFGWVGFPLSGTTPYVPSNTLNIVKYQSGVGWGEVITAPRIDSFSYLGNRVDLVAVPGNEVLAIAQDTKGFIYSNTFSATGEWGGWQNVDYNLDLFDIILGRPRVSSNSKHDIMLTWSEETKDELGETVYRVYSNQYNSAPDSNGFHWSLPQRIATLPLTNGSNWHVEIHPQIALSSTGRAIAVWIDENNLNSTLLANEFTPGLGWSEMPDTIVSYNVGAEGTIGSPQVAIADDESTLISWRQKVRSEFSVDYRVWAVEPLPSVVQ